jgi:hypothetical protein
MALAMSETSQTAWRSDLVVRSESVSQKRKKEKKGERQGTRTRLSSVPLHLEVVPTAITRGEVQRLMHIAEEMDEELERELWSSVRHRLGPAGKVG